MAYSVTTVFMKSDSVLGAALMNENGSARPTHQESSMYDRVMSRIQNLCTEQSVDENALLGIEFWECLKRGTLQWITVPGGLYVYDCGQGLDFGSVDDYDNLLLHIEHYEDCIEEYYTLATTVEVSEPSQDWIGQEMIQPHVRVIKEMLKFTDAEIRNGLVILHDRGEEITSASLIHILGTRKDAVVNVYASTRKYGFSSDVRLVLDECYYIYGREPNRAEFDLQFNRIKGTGIEHLNNQLAVKDEEITNINRDKERLQERARLLDNQVTMEQTRAVQERNRADRYHWEKLGALKEVNIAMEARDKARALEETLRLKIVKLEQEKEEERVKAEAERVKAEAERVKNVKLEQEKEEERVKAEAERVKNVKLEQEKEAERVKAEAERVKAEAERVKNVKLEQEKEAERVKAEAERVKAEEERVKAEAERVKNVKLQKEKEAERVKAEAERVKAEAERVKAEAERVKVRQSENNSSSILKKKKEK